jgi:hypothetical protein
LAFKQTTIESASGTNSLHSRITSSVQRSWASALCAAAGLPLTATNIISDPAAMPQSNREQSHAVFFTIAYP